MSLANVQTLAAHSVAAVEAGRNLSDVLAEIWRDHPQLSAQERGALQDIAYGCQRFSGSLSHKRMLISITNHPRLATHPLKQRIKPCLQNPC